VSQGLKLQLINHLLEVCPTNPYVRVSRIVLLAGTYGLADVVRRKKSR
jgi:hypothetical protein